MITISYGQLRNQNFVNGAHKLGRCVDFDSPKVLFSVSKIYSKITEEMKAADDIYVPMLDKYAQKNDKGQYLCVPGDASKVLIKDGLETEWQEKEKEFLSIDFAIDRPKLNLTEVAKAKLSPMEINALEPILTFIGLA